MDFIRALGLAWTLTAFMAAAFNLDDKLPVIKVGPNRDAYFGYSLAQHRTMKSEDYGESVLLIGAPRDDNLQPNTTKSGALWRCRLSSDVQVHQPFISHFCHIARSIASDGPRLNYAAAIDHARIPTFAQI